LPDFLPYELHIPTLAFARVEEDSVIHPFVGSSRAVCLNHL
jgi:hypothetical protein